MFSLFTTFYLVENNKERQRELLFCLQKNVQNTLIQNVYIFLDGNNNDFTKKYINENIADTTKIKFIYIKKIPTYGDWIEYSKHFANTLGDVSVFTNADIYLDDSIEGIKSYVEQKESIVCLSRHEVVSDNEFVPHPNPQWSQDLWAISKQNILNITNTFFVDELNITPTGVYRCDNKLAYIFAMRGWLIYNPFPSIKCYHLQKDVSRSYGKLDTNIVGGLCFPSPTNNSSTLSVLDISVMPVKVGNITKCTINKYLERNLSPETGTNSVSNIEINTIASTLLSSNQIKNNNVPIVILCKNGIKNNTIEITEHAIKQAIHFKNKVYLISDFQINVKSKYFEQYNIENYYSKEYNQFNENYLHLNTNSKDFECTCFNRHIILNNFMHRKNLQAVFHMDYDVLIYCNIEKIKHIYNTFDFTLSKNQCSHNSFFTRNMYDAFVGILIDTYSLKEKHFLFKDFIKIFDNMQKANKTGGICDMTLLKHFATRKECNNKYTYGEMTDIINDTTFDYFIKNTEDYEVNPTLHIKNIVFKNNLPYCYNVTLNKLIQFNSLHFQGKYKQLIADYITYNK
jgi:hypothetical protein